MQLRNFVAQDLQGNVIPFAVVHVYNHGTTIDATGLKDEKRSNITSPLKADEEGKFNLRAPTGYYDIRITGGGRDFTINELQFVDLEEQVGAVTALVSNAQEAVTAASQAAGEASRSAILAENAAASIVVYAQDFTPARLFNEKTQGVWLTPADIIHQFSSILPEKMIAGISQPITAIAGKMPAERSAGSIMPPFGFPWSPPFKIWRVAPQQYATDFDPNEYILPPVQTYYLDPAGNDANDGLSPDRPKQSIRTLILSLNASLPSGPVTLILAAGWYEYNSGMYQASMNFDCNIICPNGRAVIAYTVTPTWTKTIGRANIWETPMTGAPAIIDLSNPDEFNIPRRLRIVSSLDDLDTQPNNLTQGGSNLYVHTFDSREPDAALLVFAVVSSLGWSQTHSQRIFMRNVDMWGWAAPANINHGTSATPGRYVFDECSFNYSRDAENGFGTASTATPAEVLTILHKCTAAYNRLDGFSYRGNHRAIEIDCLGVWNGYTGPNPNDNGSTTHNSVQIIRIGGLYRYNNDRNVHDVNTTRNWMLGCTAGDAQNGSSDPYNNANFICGTSGASELTRSWMEGCISLGGSASDIMSAGSGTLEVLDCIGMDAAFELNTSVLRHDAQYAWAPGGSASAVWPQNPPRSDVSAQRPTLINAGSGRKAWHFDGNGALWLGGTSVGKSDLFADATDSFCIALVYRVESVDENRALLSKAGSSSESSALRMLLTTTAGGSVAIRLRGGPTVNVATGVADGNFHVVILNWDGESATAMHDNTTEISVAVGSAPHVRSNVFLAGRNNGTQERLVGDMGDVLVIDKSLSVSVRTLLMNYFKTIYQ